jgi:hypothetical protein
VRNPGRGLTAPWLGMFALVVVAGRPTSALAAEPELQVVLQYGVDASVRGCWDEAEFRRSVAHRIGYDPFRDDAPLDVRVRVGGAANAVDGHVEWRKANGMLMGERRFVAKDGNCAKLLTEMSFAVGLQIDLLRPKTPAGPVASGPAAGGAEARPTPGGGAASPSPEQTATVKGPDANEKPSPTAREKPSVATEPAHETQARAPSWSLWLGGGPSLAWRLSPSITADGRLFVGIRRGYLSLELGAEATYPSSERRWDGSGFRQHLVGGTLALCGHHAWFSACGLGRGSAVLVTGVGVDDPRSPAGFLVQAGGRLAASFPLHGAWWWGGHIDAVALLTPSRVVLNDARVWDMPRLGVLAGMDLMARFR